MNTFLVISKIRGAATSYKTLESTEDWMEAIRHAKNYNLYMQNDGSFTGLKYDYPKYYNTAVAAKRLKELGVSVHLDDIELESDHYEPVLDLLEKKIEQFGGINVINSIYNFLVENHLYYKDFNLYSVALRLGFSPRPGESEAMIPVGFLLNVAAKYPVEKQFRDKQQMQTLLNEIVEIAVCIAAVMEVQPYSIWEVQFRHNGEFPKFIMDIALFDAAFTIPSYDIKQVLEFTRHAFSWVDIAKFEAEYGFTIEEYFTVSQSVAGICGQSHSCTAIYLSALKKSCRLIPNDRVERIAKHLSHASGTVNAGYRYPNDYDKCDIGFKPLIELSPTKFIICNSSWASIAFYEVLADLTRNIYDQPKPVTDIRIGKALETFVFSKLSEKGIVFYTGKYADGQKTDGECDGLIETTNAIVLVEIKKKGLSRHARSGKDTYLIVDLAAGLLDAQIQAGRTEILLRKQGYIDLEDPQSGAINRIELKGRTIERLALSQMDYGSFQDRTVINGLLSFLIDTRLSLKTNTDPDMVKKIAGIQKKSEIWDRQAIELQALDPHFDRSPFYGCWFLNLWQFLLILEYADSNDTFYEAFRSIKSVSLGSSNFYFEFYHGFAARNQKRNNS